MKVEYNCPECEDFKPIMIKEETKIIHQIGSHIGFEIFLEQEKKDLVCERCGSYLVRKGK